MDEQLIKVLKLLREAKFPTNWSRKNIYRGDSNSYKGFVLGIVRLRATPRKIYGVDKHPSRYTRSGDFTELHQACDELMKLHDPDFKYTSIQLNKNIAVKKRKDSYNKGESYVIGLGDYTDGELTTYDEHDVPTKNDIHNKFFKFNGAKVAHEVISYEGTERYSLVYFSA